MPGTIAARIDDTTIRFIRILTKEERSDKSAIIRDVLAKGVRQRLIDLAINKYAENEMSLGKAAEFADIPVSDFMAELAERKVALNYSVDSFETDVKATAL